MTSIKQQETSRNNLLRFWMIEKGVTFKYIAEKIGCSAQRACNALHSENISRELWEKYRQIGIPEELLPQPFVRKSGRRPRQIKLVNN